MYKIKIQCDRLKHNTQKLKESDLKNIVNLLNLPSYPFVQSSNLVRKTFARAHTQKPFTSKSLEIMCDRMISIKTLRKFVKKLKSMRLQGQNVNVHFIDVLSNHHIHSIDFESGECQIIDTNGHRYKNRSTYSTTVVYKK